MKIFKYPIHPGLQDISLPRTAVLIFAGLDGVGDPCVWAQVDPDSKSFTRQIRVVATGEDYDEKAWIYAFSWVAAPLVWHLMVSKEFYLIPMDIKP